MFLVFCPLNAPSEVPITFERTPDLLFRLKFRPINSLSLCILLSGRYDLRSTGQFLLGLSLPGDFDFSCGGFPKESASLDFGRLTYLAVCGLGI